MNSPSACFSWYLLPARLLFWAGLWVAVAALFAIQLYALGIMPWRSAILLCLLDWAPWIVFAPLVVLLARRIPINPQTWRRAVPAHLALCALVVVMIGASTLPLSSRRELLFESRKEAPAAGEGEVKAELRRHGPPDTFWARILGGSRVSIPVYWMLVAGAQAVAQYRRGVERERRALRAEAHLAEARLLALQGQLNPHFLFNTLNTIAEPQPSHGQVRGGANG